MIKKLRWLKKHFMMHPIRNLILIVLSLSAIFLGILMLWFTTIEIPDLTSFQNRRISQSTKIFDRTGKILLYDVHADAKRTLVKWDDISDYIKKATIAIEDNDFYSHKGIKPTSILRAVIANITSIGFSQGGSTITQQVIKNTVLTNDKTITRKFKEWILALKLERVLSKDEILTTYLNESPYGGNIYGVEEASRQFFGKSAKDVNLAESAYLAALPQAPTFYSPFGKNRDRLDARQKLVLKKMLENDYISEEEYKKASNEKVEFFNKSEGNIRAPHFSLYVRDYLIEKYGEEKVMSGGLKVTTSLDYELQQKAEETVKSFADTLKQNFGANNIAMSGIDPRNGDILVMVGSKDYFDQSIDGNVNITTSLRQPGSAFKPIVYATAWEKGYTPETVLFDVQTEFSSECEPDGKTKFPEAKCYSPKNYDDLYLGPMTMKKALAQSRNIPAVKTLYLTGLKDSVDMAKKMGITTLTNPASYGLTLVLGGGEVSLLELTGAYGSFANEGKKVFIRSILKIEDSEGNILEEAGPPEEKQIMNKETTRRVSDALSDPKVRLDSLNEALRGIRQPVAVKTGTTNDYKDVWIVGYTPEIVVGAWAGNNDNSPMQKKVAGVIITPVWGKFMQEILKSKEPVDFNEPEPLDKNLPPVLKGVWQGNISYFIDKISGKIATDLTPEETIQERVFNQVHSILYWIDKDNPTKIQELDYGQKGQKDSQFENWEYGVQKWFSEWKKNNPDFIEAKKIIIPTEKDDIHTKESIPVISLEIIDDSGEVIRDNKIDLKDSLNIRISIENKYPITKTEYYINNTFVGSKDAEINDIKINLDEFNNLEKSNELTVIVYDKIFNKAKSQIVFRLK